MKNKTVLLLRKIASLTALVGICGMAQFALAGAVVHANDAATNQKISQSEVIARAQDWVYQGFTYNTNASKPDVLGTPYRTDCSGLVSMAWHLDQSYTTANFNVDKAGMWHTISPDSMTAGDAYVRHDSTEQHIELFAYWDDPSDHSKGFEVYSFNDTGYTVENPIQLNNVGKSGHRSFPLPSGFHAIRYDNIISATAGGTTDTLVSSAKCSAATTYALPGSTVAITERTCYARSTVDSPPQALFTAYEEIKWTGGGAAKLDGLTPYVDIQKNDQTTTEGDCSGFAIFINASPTGTQYCRIAISNPSAGTWTADGWLHYDVHNDGKIWNLVYVTGSPATTY